MKTKRRKVDPAKIRKLHKLLALGMKDLRRQERAKNSVVDMSTWLKRNGKCRACLAGSVLRWTCGITESVPTAMPVVNATGSDWPYVLNAMRQGIVSNGFWEHTAMEERLRFDRYIPNYSDDREAWWAAMRTLHADLKAADI